MNIVLDTDKSILCKTYGDDLWFCEFCHSFMFWDETKKAGTPLRLRQFNDPCYCLYYKEMAKNPQPEIQLEYYEEEMVFFPATPSEVVKMIKKSRVKLIFPT